MAGKTIRYRARVELLNNDAWNIPLHSESDIDFVYNETVVRARATDGNVIMFPVRNVASIKDSAGEEGPGRLTHRIGKLI